MAKSGKSQIYQLKITLEVVKPPIWRCLLVPASTSLKNLHYVFQAVLGWEDDHLHEFEVNGVRYGEHDTDFSSDTRNEARVKLNQVLRLEKEVMYYDYDFGDGWRHKVVLEKVLESTPEIAAPLCVAGARACPPEDCGGPWGYAELLKAIADSSHPEHEEMLDWVGEEFDPEYFDVDDVNACFDD